MMGCFRRGYCGDGGGVVVLVVAAPWAPCCPHPSPLPPSGRGDALLWVRGTSASGWCCGSRYGGDRDCCLNWDSWDQVGIFGIWCWLLGGARRVAILSGVVALTAYPGPDDDE